MTYEENLLGIDYNIEGHETDLKYETENPVVTMYIEKYGSVVMELYPDVAPNTVNNFISLVKSGFYDNVNDCQYLLTDQARERITEYHYKALVEYIKKILK